MTVKTFLWVNPQSGAIQLTLKAGNRSLVMRCGKRVKTVECDERTQPDQVAWYTEVLLRAIDGVDLLSMISCMKITAEDCETVQEFVEEVAHQLAPVGGVG